MLAKGDSWHPKESLDLAVADTVAPSFLRDRRVDLAAGVHRRDSDGVWPGRADPLLPVLHWRSGFPVSGPSLGVQPKHRNLPVVRGESRIRALDRNLLVEHALSNERQGRLLVRAAVLAGELDSAQSRPRSHLPAGNLWGIGHRPAQCRICPTKLDRVVRPEFTACLPWILDSPLDGATAPAQSAGGRNSDWSALSPGHGLSWAPVSRARSKQPPPADVPLPQPELIHSSGRAGLAVPSQKCRNVELILIDRQATLSDRRPRARDWLRFAYRGAPAAGL